MNDYLIIGGGISGLYTAYRLNKKDPNKKIILFEKNDYFGGRVKGFSYKNLSWEEGAGRFNSNHKILIKLLKELNLKNEIIKINSKTKFVPLDRNKYSDEILKHDTYYYINKIIALANKDKKTNLIDYTFEEYSRMRLGDEITDYIIDSYGYNVELTVMNLVDSIRMFSIDMNPNVQFYTMKGGMHIIIDKLVKYLNKCHNIKMYKNAELVDLKHPSEFLAKIYINGQKIKYVKSHNCILAIPRYGLEKIDLLTSNHVINQFIKSVICKPLCRIYSIFRKSWFSDIGKTTTNSKIRYIIPIDNKNGLIMSSYTDGKYADRINKYYLKYGYDKLNNMLVKELNKVFPDREIEKPEFTNISYWECGAGYWRKGVNSKLISDRMLHPIENMNLFIVGENYSLSQAWIEGGLQTVDKLIN